MRVPACWLLLGLIVALNAAEVKTFSGVTCQQVGDYVINTVELEKPVMSVRNGNPRLTFTSKPFELKGIKYPGGYKTIYTFGGTMKHEPLSQDYCTVDINGTAKTPVDEANAERLKMALLHAKFGR